MWSDRRAAPRQGCCRARAHGSSVPGRRQRRLLPLNSWWPRRSLLRASIMPARAAVGKRLERRVRYHPAKRQTVGRRGGEEERMKLALFNDYRLGVVRGDTIVDV